MNNNNLFIFTTILIIYQFLILPTINCQGCRPGGGAIGDPCQFNSQCCSNFCSKKWDSGKRKLVSSCCATRVKCPKDNFNCCSGNCDDNGHCIWT